MRVQGALLAGTTVFDTGRGQYVSLVRKIFPIKRYVFRYIATYSIGRFNRSLEYSSTYMISVAVNGFSIPGSPFSSPACVGFEYHPRIFSIEVKSLN
jgi:hypothetical protein